MAVFSDVPRPKTARHRHRCGDSLKRVDIAGEFPDDSPRSVPAPDIAMSTSGGPRETETS